jgi:hypothetical protein
MGADFIQEALLGVLAVLYAGLLYEIRQLRKAKHAQAQHVQYALLCIALIARELNIELPSIKSDDE